jgi:hypothetical protein
MCNYIWKYQENNDWLMGLFYGAFQLTNYLSNWVTNVMEQSYFWYANSCLAPQKVPRLLWNVAFVTLFIWTHNWNLSWAGLIHFTTFKTSSLRSMYALSHRRQHNPSFLFPSGYVTRIMCPFLNSWISLGFEVGRAIAQAVSRRLLNAAAPVRAQAKSFGICGGQNGTVVGLLPVLRFFLPILIPPIAPYLSSSIIWD